MIDTASIKADLDLRTIVERDLGPPAKRSGQAHLYKCPFHHERNGLSLAIWQDGYRCFGKCDRAGDLFDWLMTYHHLSFLDAVALIGNNCRQHNSYGGPTHLQHHPISTTEPPAPEWQSAARDLIVIAEDTLWSSTGEHALAYLLNRGLNTRTIRDARLGFVAGHYQQWRDICGLRVPCGILIPWLAAEAIWAIKIRRSYGHPKYLQVAHGSSHGLYNADRLHEHTTAIFCEGEFDTLLLQQEAGRQVTPVTLGSATARLTTRWLSELVHHRTLLVAYDNDQAGHNGYRHLQALSPRFRRLHLPDGNDISDFYLNGGDVLNWVTAELTAIQQQGTQ